MVHLPGKKYPDVVSQKEMDNRKKKVRQNLIKLLKTLKNIKKERKSRKSGPDDIYYG